MMSDIREDAIASNNQSLPLLERRIDRMEYSVGNAISRVGAVAWMELILDCLSRVDWRGLGQITIGGKSEK